MGHGKKKVSMKNSIPLCRIDSGEKAANFTHVIFRTTVNTLRWRHEQGIKAASIMSLSAISFKLFPWRCALYKISIGWLIGLLIDWLINCNLRCSKARHSHKLVLLRIPDSGKKMLFFGMLLFASSLCCLRFLFVALVTATTVYLSQRFVTNYTLCPLPLEWCIDDGIVDIFSLISRFFSTNQMSF